jgi:uncharacterized membrane protein
LARFRDYYVILGVPRDATQEQIKEAYRRLVKIYHPDRNPSPEAEEMFKLINEAYQVLSDPARRAGYDVLYDSVMTKISAYVATETREEGVSRSEVLETYAAQETEELNEPERALIALCKAIVAYLLGSIKYEDLILLSNDYAKTLKSAWGSAVRPEVRRLAMEAADLAEEREELRLVALFVKLFLAEAGPPSEKSHEAGRRRVIVAGATTVRRPSEVYEDLERLLSSAQQGGYQARVSAATRAETEEEASEVHRSFETREIYVLVELPKRVKILGGLGSLFICPLLVLLIPLPYTWAMVKGDPLIITLLQMLPMVIPLWFLGFAMLMVAFKRISKMPIAKTVAKGLTLSTVAKTFLSELLAVVPGIGIMNLPNALPLLIVVIPVWLVIVAMTIDFNNNCEQLSTLTKSRTLKIVGELHVWGALLSIVLIGTVVLFIAYILQAAAFFSLPNALYIRSSETAHVSQPHGQKRKSLRNV